MTKEELYIIHDLYRDYNLGIRRLYLMSLLYNACLCGSAYRFFWENHLPSTVKLGLIGLGLWAFGGVKRAVKYGSYVNINYYLSLMQPGDQYQLHRDTVSVIGHCKDESAPLNKELSLVKQISLSAMLSYYRDRLYDFSGMAVEEDNQMKKALFETIESLKMGPQSVSQK